MDKGPGKLFQQGRGGGHGTGSEEEFVVGWHGFYCHSRTSGNLVVLLGGMACVMF